MGDLIEERLFSRIGGKERFSPQERETLERFLLWALDKGLAQGARFGSEEIQPVYMLGRKGFLKEVLSKREEVGRVVFLRLDLSNVYEANLAMDQEGQRGGDLLIAKGALAIKEAVEEFSREKSKEILCCRYGGDEFLIAGFDLGGEEIKELKELVRLKISSQTAYFGPQKEIRALSLKEGKIEIIEIETDKEPVFWKFLEEGLFLGPKELEKEKEREWKEEKEKEALGQERKDILLEILALHPELREFFEIAQKHGLVNEFLDFILDYIIDPLLGEIAISRVDLLEHLKMGHFERFAVLELKLKEINELFSYSLADAFVKELWSKVQEIITPIRENVVVGRFGGMLFLGFVQDSPRNIIEELSALRELELGWGKERVETVVGFYENALEELREEKEARELVSEFFRGASRNWLKRAFEKLKGNPREFQIISSLVRGIERDVEPQTLSPFGRLLWAYFSGKRREIRIREAQAFLEEGKGPVIRKF